MVFLLQTTTEGRNVVIYMVYVNLLDFVRIFKLTVLEDEQEFGDGNGTEMKMSVSSFTFR